MSALPFRQERTTTQSGSCRCSHTSRPPCLHPLGTTMVDNRLGSSLFPGSPAEKTKPLGDQGQTPLSVAADLLAAARQSPGEIQRDGERTREFATARSPVVLLPVSPVRDRPLSL